MIIEPEPWKDMMDKIMSYAEVMGPIEEDWMRHRGTVKQWNVLRRLYDYATPRILNGEIRSPYLVDWFPVFTPIERHVWNAIRSIGLPFFPQYPIGKVFVDFADPVKQIALECDGKEYHDAEKDAARDATLATLGWKVLRFTGRQCVLPDDDPDSADAILSILRENWYWNAVEHDSED